MVQDGKFSKEYPANAVNPVNPEGSILGPTFFLLYINEILLSILMILLYSECDHGSDLLQQQELASEH